MSEKVQGTGERFRILADTLFDGNRSDLARAIGMEPGSFTKYTRGKRQPGARVLERLTRLGVNINWFLTGEGQIMVEEKQPSTSKRPIGDAFRPMSASELLLDSNQYYPIPFVEVRVGDAGQVLLDEIGDPEWLSAAFIRHQYGVKPVRLRNFRVSSSRMADTIRPGDRIRTVLLDSNRPHEEISSGKVYVLFGPSGVFATRVCRTEETSDLILTGENPDVEDQEVSPRQWREKFRPIARVLEVVRPL